MKVYSPEVLEKLDKGEIVIRGMIRFDFGTGTYGFIRSNQPLTYNGLTYVPGGLIQVSELNDAVGLSAQQFSITLAASPDDDLTPNVLRTIEAEDYRDRPVTIFDAQFDPDTGALLSVETMRRGYVDLIRHVRDYQTGYTIIADCESRAIDYTRKNGRKRSDADQQRRYPGDKYFQNASLRGRELVAWGREATPSNVVNSGGSYNGKYTSG